MVIKLNSLTSWTTLEPAQSIIFNGSAKAERRVRISFNLERETAFFISLGEGSASLLATLPAGQEELEFFASGNFKVFTQQNAGAVQYRTSENEQTHFEVQDPIIFTKIAGRRHRNPEYEEILYRANANMEKRFAYLAEQQELQYKQMLELELARQSAANDQGNATGTGTETVPAQGATDTQSSQSGGSGTESQQQGDGTSGATGDGQQLP